MPFRRACMLVGVAVALCASPAAVAQAVQPTPQQMADAAAAMLVWEDVPASMKVAPGWEFTTKADKTLALELCTKAGKEVLAPRAPVMFQTELGETDLVNDPVAFQENVWQYADAGAAARAWAVLKQRAKQCTGKVIERTTGEASNTQILSNGLTDLEFNGNVGVWVHSYFARTVSESASTEGGYYVMYLNGDVIQSVEYDYPDTVNLGPGLRATVQRIAVDLAARWLQVKQQPGTQTP